MLPSVDPRVLREKCSGRSYVQQFLSPSFEINKYIHVCKLQINRGHLSQEQHCYYKLLIDEQNVTRWRLKYTSIGDLYIETYSLYLSIILVIRGLIRSCGVQYIICLSFY